MRKIFWSTQEANHHRIIHDANPIFDRTEILYMYPNGYREHLQLNKHL